MRHIIASFLVMTTVIMGYAQPAPNFTITDVNGQLHNLHNDYLNKGDIVVLKIFFVNCPPCNAAAPLFQSKYEYWGSGTQGVQFIELSNKVTDNNTLVQGYKNQHSLTMPTAGADGGSVEAQALYSGGTYGLFFGTPHYTVIEPDKTVHYDVHINDIDQTIMDIMGVAPGTPVSINSNLGSELPDGVSLFMKPKNAATPLINITNLTNGSHEFTYPSADFPIIDDPVLFIQSSSPAFTNQLRAGDLIPIRKHILGLEPFTDPRLIITADVNGDDRIRTGDLVDLRKVILGLEQDFPNAVPSYVMYPEEIDFEASGSNPVEISIEILKIGNVID